MSMANVIGNLESQEPSQVNTNMGNVGAAAHIDGYRPDHENPYTI